MNQNGRSIWQKHAERLRWKNVKRLSTIASITTIIIKELHLDMGR